MKMTIRQLAQYCNVSIGTIDRVLNNRPGVSPKTKEKVERSVRELGYSPNYLAQSLSTGRSMSIGVILFNLRNMFFAQLSDAIVDASDKRGLFPYLMLSERSKDQELSCVENLISRQVDGIILFSTNNDPAFIHRLQVCSLPIVTVMTKLPNLPNVGIDDYAAMNNAAKYIMSKKYERIIYISPPLSYTAMNIEVSKLRYAGFLNAIEGTGVEHMLIKDYDYLNAIDSLNMKTGKKTAFICTSDIYALNILQHLKLRGLNPPYDYGVLGFDNIETLQYVDPCISTVAVPIELIGRTAVDILADGIAGSPLESKCFPHTIVAGQTIV